MLYLYEAFHFKTSVQDQLQEVGNEITAWDDQNLLQGAQF